MAKDLAQISVRIRFMGDLRAVMGKPDQRMVLPRGSTVGDLIQSLCHSYGEPFVSRVLNQSGGIEHSIVIFLNGRNIKEIGGLAATLDAGDLEIIMLPMFEGG